MQVYSNLGHILEQTYAFFKENMEKKNDFCKAIFIGEKNPKLRKYFDVARSSQMMILNVVLQLT